MVDATTSAAGHVAVRECTDVVVDAWAPSRTECLEQLVRGVVGAFAEARPESAIREIRFELDTALDEDLVATLLEDVLYLVRADDLVVVDVVLEENEEDGTIEGSFSVAPVHAIPAIGACPTHVSRAEIFFGRDDSVWRTRVRLQT
jgi:SHS2 domain-containing protein